MGVRLHYVLRWEQRAQLVSHMSVTLYLVLFLSVTAPPKSPCALMINVGGGPAAASSCQGPQHPLGGVHGQSVEWGCKGLLVRWTYHVCVLDEQTLGM